MPPRKNDQIVTGSCFNSPRIATTFAPSSERKMIFGGTENQVLKIEQGATKLGSGSAAGCPLSESDGLQDPLPQMV